MKNKIMIRFKNQCIKQKIYEKLKKIAIKIVLFKLRIFRN